jgi:hypothetical protein
VLLQLSFILDQLEQVQEGHPFAAVIYITLTRYSNFFSFCVLLQLSFILDQLEQVQEGHPFAGRPVVILAERGKEEMDGLVRITAVHFLSFKLC